MKFRYVLYLLILMFLFSSFWIYLGLGGVEEKLDRERLRLERMLRDARMKKEKLRELKLRISEEELEPYTEMKALEVVLRYADSLRSEGFGVDVLKEAFREGSSWRMDLKLTFRPEDVDEVVRRLESMLNSKAPVVFLRGLYIYTREGRVEIVVSLYQPFLKEGR